MDQFSSKNTTTSSPWNMPKADNTPSSIEGYTFPDYGSIFSNYRTGSQNLLGSQDRQVGDYLSGYAGAIKGQESVPAMYARIGTELGLPNLMRNANQINETLAAIPETYGAATRGFDVNANQLARIIGAKTAALEPAARRATNAAQTASGQVAQLMGLTQQQQQKELLPYEYERDFLRDRIARETSLFTTANEQELRALDQKVSLGVQLTEAEKQRKQQLEMQRNDYENSRSLAEQKFGFEQKLQDPLGLFS